MKRLIVFSLCCLLLTGCGLLTPNNPPETVIPPSSESPAPETTEAPTQPITEAVLELEYQIYLPLENADGIVAKRLTVTEISAESVLAELQSHNVLPEDVVINSFTAQGTQLNIDFNQAFGDLICSMGTSGERMIVGSVANTYLNAFQMESLYFTINGEILESGHVIYDFPIEFME